MISYEREFKEIVEDILFHPKFMELKGFLHHTTSRYEHVLAVSYLSYKNAKKLNFNYRAAARGGLLHDFFLYDWREYCENNPLKEKHSSLHPKVALENSNKYFNINRIEEDIIIKHMWPSTDLPPKYREAYLVTFVDKYVSAREYLTIFRFPEVKSIKVSVTE